MSDQNYSELTQELELVYERNRQSDETRKKKMKLRRYLYDLLEPHYFVDLFLVGSSVNHLSSCDSDADMCLMFKDRADRMDQSVVAARLLEKVHQIISKESRFTDIQMIGARVPLLKFKDLVTTVNVDLNIHNIVGIRNTRLLKAYVECDSRFPKLVLVTKTWAKENGINNAHHKTLSSYTLTLMVIHFLQRCDPPVLPCLQVQDAANFTPHGDHTLYTLTGCLANFKSENTQSLGELFVLFLKYFSEEFDYDRSAISIRLGRIVSKATVRAFRSPKNNATQWNFLAVEEPFDRTNAASAVHDPLSFQKIVAVFRMSYKLIRNRCAFGFVSPLRKNPPSAPNTPHVFAPVFPVTHMWTPCPMMDKAIAK